MRLGAIVIDSNNSEELSGFYRKLLNWSIERQVFENEKGIIVKSANGECTPLVFQEVDNYTPPKWPSTDGLQQQMLHLDFYVQADDFDNEIKHAISCGARLSESEHSHQLKLMGFQRAWRHMPPLGWRISCLLYRHNSDMICIKQIIPHEA